MASRAACRLNLKSGFLSSDKLFKKFVSIIIQQLFNAVGKTFFPIRDIQSVLILYLRLVEHAVMRTYRRCGILGSVKWPYLASADTGYAVNGFGEVIPAADAFIREIIHARLNALLNATAKSRAYVGVPI